MRKFLALVITLFSMFSIVPVHSADNPLPITVLVDGNLIDFKDADPIIENDRILVPARAVFEQMGATVMWNGDFEEVYIFTDDVTIVVRIGSKVMEINNNEFLLDVSPCIKNNRTYIPLRAISESLSATVVWDNDSYCVRISTEPMNEEKHQLTFRAEKENPTPQEMHTIKSLFQTRLLYMGYTNANVKNIGDGKISVTIPKTTDVSSIIHLLGSPAVLTFRDSDGAIIINSIDGDIRHVELWYDVYSDSTPQPSILISFSEDAAKRFSYATKLASQKLDGENYIAIYIDDELISAPVVTEELSSSGCAISGDFTPESAQAFVAQLTSGILPFTMTYIEE